jgi:uncharacterized protein
VPAAFNRLQAAGEIAPVSAPASQQQIRRWEDLLDALRLSGLLLGIEIVAGGAVRWGQAPLASTQLIAAALAAVVVLAFAVPERADLARLLRLSGFSRGAWRYTLFAFLLLVAFAAVYFRVAAWLGVEMYDPVAAFESDGWSLWSVFLMVSIAPAVVEEITFRGYVLQKLERNIGRRDALYVQAALFSVLHLSPVIFVSHFVMGLILGALRHKTSSLWPCMLVHASYNATVIASTVWR